MTVAQTASLSKEIVFQSVGRSCHEWQQVEIQLAIIFSLCVAGSTYALKGLLNRDLAISAYDTVDSAEKRLQLVTACIQKVLNACAQIAQSRPSDRFQARLDLTIRLFQDVLMQTEPLLQQHKDVCRGSLRQAPDGGFFWELQPRLFEPSPSDEGYTPAFRFNAADIDALADTFSDFVRRLESFTGALHELRLAQNHAMQSK